MEKGLKWLFSGLIAATILMFILMVSSVNAQVVFSDGEHGYWQNPSYNGYCTMPPTVLIPQVDKNTTSSSQNFINNSVTRDNNFQPNVTVNTPKPQR